LSKELLNHPSEYHYLFSKVAGAVLANGSGELPLLGNAARRMFEGFISFRAPQGLDFQAKVTSVSAASKIDPTLSNRVVKFLHGHSHREDPTPLTSIDFPSIELELQSVLNYMREADSLHFSNMCKAVGVAEADLEHIVSSV
jgi:wobble nucleotide-excising tRNase